MVSVFGFRPRGSGFESLGIFSAVENVSTCSEDRVQCYIVVPPLVRQFQPTPARFTATHNHSGVAGFPPVVKLAPVRTEILLKAALNPNPTNQPYPKLHVSDTVILYPNTDHLNWDLGSSLGANTTTLVLSVLI